MDEHRLIQILGTRQYLQKLRQTVSVYRSEISKAELFKKHTAALEHRVFDVVFQVSQTLRQPFADAWDRTDLIFNKIFRAQISLGSPQRSQMSGYPADIRRDRHTVIVEDHDHLGFGSADIV